MLVSGILFCQEERNMGLFSKKDSDYGRREVKVCTTREEAEMYRDMLDQADIPSIIMAKDVGRQHPEFNITGVHLMVNGDDYEKACDVLGTAK